MRDRYVIENPSGDQDVAAEDTITEKVDRCADGKPISWRSEVASGIILKAMPFSRTSMANHGVKQIVQDDLLGYHNAMMISLVSLSAIML